MQRLKSSFPYLAALFMYGQGLRLIHDHTSLLTAGMGLVDVIAVIVVVIVRETRIEQRLHRKPSRWEIVREMIYQTIALALFLSVGLAALWMNLKLPFVWAMALIPIFPAMRLGQELSKFRTANKPRGIDPRKTDLFGGVRNA